MVLPTSCPLRLQLGAFLLQLQRQPVKKAVIAGLSEPSTKVNSMSMTKWHCTDSKLYHSRWLFTMLGLMSKAALLHAWHHFWEALWTSRNEVRAILKEWILVILVVSSLCASGAAACHSIHQAVARDLAMSTCARWTRQEGPVGNYAPCHIQGMRKWGNTTQLFTVTFTWQNK